MAHPGCLHAMNLRSFVILSLGLNLCLGLALGYYVARKPATVEPAAPAKPPVTPTRVPQRTVAARETAVPRNGAFNWANLESADFKQYMANLRAIGCPEETIRDLIVAEVNKLMAPKFAALAAEANRMYWKPRN